MDHVYVHSNEVFSFVDFRFTDNKYHQWDKECSDQDE